MSVSIADFRAAFPAFTPDAFPDESVSYRLTLAEAFFSPAVWSDENVRGHAICLFVAHNLAMYGSVNAGGDGSTMAGTASGAVASKSVDGASISFDTGAFMDEDAGIWNATPYGRELWWMMQIFGAGARQL